jgi:mRNA interferase MazF
MEKARNLKRGEVVWVNLDPTIGAEIRKQRPCVIVSLSVLNDQRLTVVVVPLSGASTPRPPLVVAIPSAGPRSNARIDQIRAVDKARIGETLGKLTREEMSSVEQALRTVLGL